MGNLFGSSKPKSAKPQPSRITEADKAVLQLKQQRDKLKQYQKKIHLSLERERQLAKQLLQEGITMVLIYLSNIKINMLYAYSDILLIRCVYYGQVLPYRLCWLKQKL